MNHVFWESDARGNRRGSADPGKELAAGLALLLIVATGTAGCGGDPITGDEEVFDSISQAWPEDGHNGITPAILAAGHLGDVNTFPFNVNSALDNRPKNLCQSFTFDSGANAWVCVLKNEWKNWLFAYGANHAITKDRYYLTEAMVQCAMTPNVVVQVPIFPSLKGMFGLYTTWALAPLEMHEREVLSACVAAKVNAFGAVVPMAFVGPDVPQAITDPSYMYQEAAFFGDLFGKKPLMMACSGKKIGGGSYVVGKNLRVCGQPNNPCHIKALGACDAGTFVCQGWAGSGSEEHCVVASNGVGGFFKHPLTVYLQTEPALIAGDVARCGLSGVEKCDDKNGQ